MTYVTRRTAAIVLAVALSIPAYAAAAREGDERGFNVAQRIFAVAKKFQKLLGRATTNTDQPMPPKP